MKIADTVIHHTHTLKVGDEAPDFTLNTHNEGQLNLKWYRGRKIVVLAFYPGDWTPVCTVQIPDYQKEIERFHQLNTQVLGISVDSIPCHVAWARSLGGISFPLMSDFYPHGEVCAKYGVLNARGVADRVVVVIDMAGKIAEIENVDTADLPSNDRLYAQLTKLNS